MDANFRLKNQLASNYSQDPGLGIGWAYMVPRRPYEEYVLGRANDTDVSSLKLFKPQLNSSFWSDKYLRWFPGFGASE
jgi:hypothetical protein